MNPKGKKFISLFIIFSLVILSVNLYAKERRGVKLIVTKKDGQQTEGELITVKPTSLLLLNTEGNIMSGPNLAETKHRTPEKPISFRMNLAPFNPAFSILISNKPANFVLLGFSNTVKHKMYHFI
jgi:hypothetical protein